MFGYHTVVVSCVYALFDCAPKKMIYWNRLNHLNVTFDLQRMWMRARQGLVPRWRAILGNSEGVKESVGGRRERKQGGPVVD